MARDPRGPHMILEMAQIDVKPGLEAEFEQGVQKAVPIFKRAKGCKGPELKRSVEKPRRYHLLITWETLENHTVDFRGSPDFAEWRKCVGHCFESTPEVQHGAATLKGF
jgi:heme-degrading monooxygenase HmoA